MMRWLLCSALSITVTACGHDLLNPTDAGDAPRDAGETIDATLPDVGALDSGAAADAGNGGGEDAGDDAGTADAGPSLCEVQVERIRTTCGFDTFSLSCGRFFSEEMENGFAQ